MVVAKLWATRGDDRRYGLVECELGSHDGRGWPTFGRRYCSYARYGTRGQLPACLWPPSRERAPSALAKCNEPNSQGSVADVERYLSLQLLEHETYRGRVGACSGSLLWTEGLP